MYLLLFFLCVLTSITDIANRKIYNGSVLAIFLVCTMISDDISDLINVMFIMLVGLFLGTLKLIAYGDVKLAAALAAAIPFDLLPVTLILVVLFGGVLSAFYFVYYRLILKLPKGKDPGLPYGVAICSGFYLSILTFNT